MAHFFAAADTNSGFSNSSPYTFTAVKRRATAYCGSEDEDPMFISLLQVIVLLANFATAPQAPRDAQPMRPADEVIVGWERP
jgi:hypothetical protein